MSTRDEEKREALGVEKASLESSRDVEAQKDVSSLEYSNWRRFLSNPAGSWRDVDESGATSSSEEQ